MKKQTSSLVSRQISPIAFRLRAAAASAMAGFAAVSLSACFEKSKDATSAASAPKLSHIAPTGAGGGSGTDDSLIETIIPGAGSTLAPTGDALIGRIKKGLKGNGATVINEVTGRCQQGYSQVVANLNYSPNPMKANLGSAISLLAYSCCSDAKPADFGVSGTVLTQAATQKQLADAGVKILGAYLGELATAGAEGPRVAQVFQNLTTQNAAVAGTTVAKVFVHNCVAAVAYGASMTGF